MSACSTSPLAADAAAIYDAALRGVDPETAVTRALGAEPPRSGCVRLLAVGKAARGMAKAAIAHLARSGLVPTGGLLVTAEPGPSPHPALHHVTGDHPLPGPGSAAAAAWVSGWVRQLGPEDEAWVLLSGGASSLIGAPIAEIPPADYRTLQELLFRAGLPISELNAVRKRFSCWGAGRLGAAIPTEHLRVLVLSDVPSDDPVVVGSGPCAPDPTTAAQVMAIIDQSLGPREVPVSVRSYLGRVVSGELPETAKPGDAAFHRGSIEVVGSNRIAREGGAQTARTLGYDVIVDSDLIAGDAAAAGRALVDRVAGTRIVRPTAWIAGGETTVTLGLDSGTGGRCQELCLAAAERLATLEGAEVVLLAAGTDGRDGPTDAAGAIVDRVTWARIRAARIDPDLALQRHDAYPALDAAGALLRTGPTGTNVMDLVVALGRPA